MRNALYHALRTNSGSFTALAAIRRACAYNLLRLCDCAN
jgi:hypothetical protein